MATGQEYRGDTRRGYSKGDFTVIMYFVKYGILQYSLTSTPISVQEEELTALSSNRIVNSLSSDRLAIV